MVTDTQTHTPGPWRISKNRTGEPDPWIEGAPGYEQAIFGDDGSKVAVCEQWHPDLEAESEANAALIASAPDLLEALEALRGDLLRYPNDDARREMIIDAADAAIAKAKGE